MLCLIHLFNTIILFKIFLRVAEETGVDAASEPPSSVQPSVTRAEDQPEEPESGGNLILDIHFCTDGILSNCWSSV